MADKLIGSLIYDDHPIPKRGARLAVKIRRAVIVIAVAGSVTFLIWKFFNYREERRVAQFLEMIQAGQYEEAYAGWDAGSSYKLKDFIEDWGRDGYWTSGMKSARVVDSDGVGGSVIVCVEIDNVKRLVPIMVDKETLRLSYPPNDRCNY